MYGLYKILLGKGCKKISLRVADVLTVRSLKFKFFVKSTDSNTLKRNRDGSVSINEY